MNNEILSQEETDELLGAISKNSDEYEKLDSYKPIKFDNTKTRLELLPPDALIVIGQVLSHGGKKYEDHNWAKGSGIVWDRYMGALLRHMMMFMVGSDTDHDSGLPILAHIACNSLFLLSSYLRNIGVDTRWKLDKEVIGKLQKAVDDYNSTWEDDDG